jgi:hypothetical protein
MGFSSDTHSLSFHISSCASIQLIVYLFQGAIEAFSETYPLMPFVLDCLPVMFCVTNLILCLLNLSS